MQNQDNFQKGYLRISVYDETEGRPLNNVRVSINSPGEDGETIEQLVTDSSGNTETIDLGAPDIGYSLEPESSVRPYSEYNVTVNYLFADDSVAYEKASITVKYGESFSITSPIIDGFVADYAIVSGTVVPPSGATDDPCASGVGSVTGSTAPLPEPGPAGLVSVSAPGPFSGRSTTSVDADGPDGPALVSGAAVSVSLGTVSTGAVSTGTVSAGFVSAGFVSAGFVSAGFVLFPVPPPPAFVPADALPPAASEFPTCAFTEAAPLVLISFAPVVFFVSVPSKW